MKNRGLYGQSDGSERRNAVAAFDERLADNELVEGREVATLRRMASEHDWRAFESYANELKQKHSRERVDSMVARATVGLKF